jgi:hypothetical protein
MNATKWKSTAIIAKICVTRFTALSMGGGWPVAGGGSFSASDGKRLYRETKTEYPGGAYL